MATSRKVWVGGNWKCNPAQRATVATICETLSQSPSAPANCQVVICPAALHFTLAQDGLKKRQDVELGVQNVWTAKAGAWTGELTCDMVVDSGAKWVILGHSERRHTVSKETSFLVGDKLKLTLAAGLNAVACVGEKLEDRQNGTTMDVVTEQLAPIVENADEDCWTNERLVIAYEPVWAIGTGVVATPDQAQETHKNIRAWLTAKVGAKKANAVRIVYGGSVTAANCEDLIKREDIDGFLVGGASLKPAEFTSIIASSVLKAKI